MSNRKTIVELYKSNGEYRWRMRDFNNHKIICASSESYKRRIYAVRNLERVGCSWMGTDNDELLDYGRVVVEHDE